jgi:transposase
LRCERGSVDVVCPPVLPFVADSEEDQVRAVALEVHRDFCEVAIVAEGRLRSAGRIATTPEALELFAQSLDARDRVALEVTGNAWAIAAILEPHVARVIVVSPSDTGIRRVRAKTDRLDARALARLLWTGQLDGVWTPDERVRAMRRRLARRSQLVRARARAKNEIHAVLMRCLKDRPPASDLFGVKGRAWLAEQQLALCERETVDSAMRQVEFLDSEIAELDKLIAAKALSWPEVKRLMTVPGVNVIVAATFMAAVGDIRRFPDRRKLTAYLGLDPRVCQSGAGPAPMATSPSRAQATRVTRSSRRAGRRSASPAPSPASISASKPAGGTRSPSSPPRASSRVCSGAYSAPARITPSRNRR